jgi:transposase
MLFMRLLMAIADAKLQPTVVMESTSTYGDPIRYQCHKIQLPVAMMSPKHTHDYAEIFDGVPSMHDGKAAAVLARLQAIKPARVWQPDVEMRRDMRALLDMRWPLSKTLSLYFGHLESMLARHWPEFDHVLDVRQTRGWMTLLKEYPGPQAVASAEKEASQTLRKATRGRMQWSKINEVIESATQTVGVPMTDNERNKLRMITQQIGQCTEQLDSLDEQLKDWVTSDTEMSLLTSVVGPACAAAIISYLGHPSQYGSAKAFEKAMGLNLKEKSSGNVKGALKLTKRGPSQVRQLLYLAALRVIANNEVVRAWYQGRKSFQAEKTKNKAVVAVMRKLARALFHVARGEHFDATKLFDVRRLRLRTNESKKKQTSESNNMQAKTSSNALDASRTSSVRKTSPRKAQGGFAQQRA